MKKLLLVAPLLLSFTLCISSCGKDDSEKSQMKIVNTSWSDIRDKFAENSVEATDFYDKHAVQLTGYVSSINQAVGYAGTLMMNFDADESVLAAIDISQKEKIKILKSGDSITIVCYSVPVGMSLDDCSIK